MLAELDGDKKTFVSDINLNFLEEKRDSQKLETMKTKLRNSYIFLWL